jgi:hypothetical protein
VSIVAAATTPPAKVKGITVEARRGTTRITWRAVPGATSYRVRISKPGGSRYKAWTTTTKRAFKCTTKKGQRYRFQIAAKGPGGRGPLTTIRFKGK